MTRRAYMKKWRRENRAKVLAYVEKRKPRRAAIARKNKKKLQTYHRGKRLERYDMTHADFAARKKAQGGVCAICEKARKLVVDHDHETGKVRGLLCNQCNTALGLFKDDTVSLARAVEYLKQSLP